MVILHYTIGEGFLALSVFFGTVHKCCRPFEICRRFYIHQPLPIGFFKNLHTVLVRKIHRVRIKQSAHCVSCILSEC